MFGEGDPLFPATAVAPGQTSKLFEAAGLSRAFWAGTSPIRAIFKAAFAAAGVPYANPHSIRHTLTEHGQRLYRNDIERLKAWSQNLGHESLLTTIKSYGAVSQYRQAEIMKDAPSVTGGGTAA